MSGQNKKREKTIRFLSFFAFEYKLFRNAVCKQFIQNLIK